MSMMSRKNWMRIGCAGLLLVPLLCIFWKLLHPLTGFPTQYGFHCFVAQSMLSAATNGDLDTVKEIVARHPEMANCDDYGIKGDYYSVLGIAIDNGNTAVAKFLLDKGANPNFHTHHSTPLILAVANGNCPVAKTLVEHGAKLVSPYGSALSRAIYCRQWKMCTLLRSLGANDVPLAFEAAAKGDIDLLKHEILKAPAILNAGALGYPSITHVAVRFGRVHSIRALVKLGADINRLDYSTLQGPPIALACENGDIEAVKALAENGAKMQWDGFDTEKENGLYYAGSHENVVRYLLDKGLDPNVTREAITSQLLMTNNMEITQMLVDHGFLPDKAELKKNLNLDDQRYWTKVETYLWKHSK